MMDAGKMGRKIIGKKKSKEENCIGVSKGYSNSFIR